jgi:hypothetical protein
MMEKIIGEALKFYAEKNNELKGYGGSISPHGRESFYFSIKHRFYLYISTISPEISSIVAATFILSFSSLNSM